MNVILTIVVVILSLYGLFFIHFLPYQIKGSNNQNAVKNALFYVSNHGMHTGIIVEAKAFNTYVDLSDYFPDVTYYEIGWGDATYYQKIKTTQWDGFKALAIPSSTVLHIVGFNQIPSKYFKHVKTYNVDSKGLENLHLFLKNSFSFEDQKAVDLGMGLYGKSRFFQAKGVYFFANTCNKWTAKGLNSAGVDTPVHFTLFANDIFIP